MTLTTQQCSICLAHPPYDACIGKDCAATVHWKRECEAAQAYATRLQGRPICERGDAVNLARNATEYPTAGVDRITLKGVKMLCDAVLRMDAWIKEHGK